MLQVQHQQLDLRGELNGHRYEPKMVAIYIWAYVFLMQKGIGIMC